MSVNEQLQKSTIAAPENSRPLSCTRRSQRTHQRGLAHTIAIDQRDYLSPPTVMETPSNTLPPP